MLADKCKMISIRLPLGLGFKCESDSVSCMTVLDWLKVKKKTHRSGQPKVSNGGCHVNAIRYWLGSFKQGMGLVGGSESILKALAILL